jgi:hypothetical protein
MAGLQFAPAHRAPPTGEPTMALRFRLLALLLVALAPLAARADTPGDHPRYLHALTDLRDAYWFLGHPREGALEGREQHALEEISRAIGIVERAASWDGKNVREHKPEDVNVEGMGGRLRKVSALLRAARADIARDEDNFAARVLQFQAVERIDESIQIVEGVMVERERMTDEHRREEAMMEERRREEMMRHERHDRDDRHDERRDEHEHHHDGE